LVPERVLHGTGWKPAFRGADYQTTARYWGFGSACSLRQKKGQFAKKCECGDQYDCRRIVLNLPFNIFLLCVF
jgi:hypothetical protein